MKEIWRPSVTVAAVIEQDGRFLLVEELQDGRSGNNFSLELLSKSYG